MIAERLPTCPSRTCVGSWESLHLRLAYQLAAQAVEVELTLVVDEQPDPRGEVAEVWSVPLARIERRDRRSAQAFVQVEAIYPLV